MRTLINVLSRVIRHPLNEGHQLKAIWRFASWQMRARLLRRPLIVNWVEGAKLIASFGDSGVTGNIYTGLFEFPEMSFLLHALRKSDTFVDVGANAGCYTVLASKVVGGRTIAFEPIPGTFQRLLANIHLNCVEHLVDAHNLGLSDGPGKLSFSSNQDSMNHVIRSDEDDECSVEVDVASIDSLISEAVFLIKIDVEGFEYPVLKGAARLLSGNYPAAVILELNNSGEKYGYNDSDIVELMREFEFLPFEYEPFSRQLKPLDGKNGRSANTIFVRDKVQVEKRVQGAQTFVVNGKTF